MLQEVLGLSRDRWNFESFYSLKPESDLFICKALVSGAVGIYLNAIDSLEMGRTGSVPTEASSMDRVVHLFNAFLSETCGGRDRDPCAFDPFTHELEPDSIPIDEGVRREYRERTETLFGAFQEAFGVRDCVDILGFDPLRYEEYDEETQEIIEEGGWMEKCIDCMQKTVRTIGEMESGKSG